MALSDWIAGHGKLCIAVVVVFTILMGAVSIKGFEVSVDIEEMAPDTPEIQAYGKVMGITGGETTFAQLLFIAEDGGNILTVERLSKILELEKELLDNETVNSTLISAPIIGEFMSIADIIAIGRIFNEFMKGATSSMDSSILPDFIMKKFLDFVHVDVGEMRNITMDDKKAAFLGTNATNKIDPPISVEISLSADSWLLNQILRIPLGGMIKDINDQLSRPIEMGPMDNASLKESLDLFTNPSFGIPGMSIPGMDLSGFNPSMITSLISKDFCNTTMRANATMVMIPMSVSFANPLDNSNSTSPSQALTDIVESSKIDGVQIRIMSSSQVNHEVERATNELMSLILPIAVILIFLILLFILGGIIDTFIALFALVFAMIWTIGESVLLGFPLNQMTLTIPILLVGLGIDFGIHLVLRYKEESEKNNHNHHRAASRAVKHVGMPLLLATGVTAIAFLSNISSPIPPIKDFGVLAALSIASCLVIMILFVPAAKSLGREKKQKSTEDTLELTKSKKRKKGKGNEVLGSGISFIARKGHTHPLIIGIILLVTCVASLIGAFSLETGFDQTDFLPEGSELTETVMYSTENFNVSMMMASYIYVEGNITQGVKDEMNATVKRLENNPLVRDAEVMDMSFLNADPDNVSNVAIIQVTAGVVEDEDMENLYHLLQEESQKINGVGNGTKAVPTGLPTITYTISRDLEESQYYSMALTIIVSILVMAVLFFLTRSSLILSLITVLPVGISILWVMGTMALLGMNFNLMTVMIYSLTIGLGLTYAIHITHRFTEELETIKDLDVVIDRTSRNTGVALFGAAVTTIAGFGSLMLSSMPPLQQFGFLLAMSIGYSFLVSVFILPAFLSTWAKFKYSSSQEK